MESIKAIRKYEKEVQNIQEGDQILIPLGEMGDFTATAYKVTDKGALFIFDEYVTNQPMNKNDTNKGGFEKSDLKKWIDSVLFMAFPDWLRDRITDLSIPTVGEMFGHEDEWDNEHFEPDTDEQLPLMRECKNRAAYLNNEWGGGWLRNAMKKEYSSAYFAYVINGDGVYYDSASNFLGVRPEFWLVKDKSRGHVPHKSGRFQLGFNAGLVKMEIQKKASEIDIPKQDKETTELKALMDSFVRAGFTEKQAFDIVKTMLIATFGGMR